MPRSPEEIIQAEIHICVSSLVSTLAGGYGSIENTERLHSRGRHAQAELAALTEQASKLAAPVPDYEEAAIQAGWAHGGDFDGFWFNQTEFGLWKAAASSDDAATYESAQKVCEFEDIEPYDREVFEHWAISDWLADRLEAKGEKIDRDFAGLTVWARTTTGQAIAMDSVICEIAADLAREYGEA